jgi:hypothetical protein
MHSVNTVPATKNTTLASATFRTSGDHVLWSHHSLLVASKAGAAPTSATDQYMPASYELTYDCQLASHYGMNNDVLVNTSRILCNAYQQGNRRLFVGNMGTNDADTDT